MQKSREAYFKHLFSLADRRFIEDETFLFYCYNLSVRRKLSHVVASACKSQGDITLEQLQEAAKAQKRGDRSLAMHIISRLAPFASSMHGVGPDMKRKRGDLYAMLATPLKSEDGASSSPMWFDTHSASVSVPFFTLSRLGGG